MTDQPRLRPGDLFPALTVALPGGTPIGTVMARLYRGRRQLRELLINYAAERGMGGAVSAAGPQRPSSGEADGCSTDALATSSDRRTALAHFVQQISSHDAALLREALGLARPESEKGPAQ